jgi:hypothetical protein
MSVLGAGLDEEFFYDPIDYEIWLLIEIQNIFRSVGIKNYGRKKLLGPEKYIIEFNPGKWIDICYDKNDFEKSNLFLRFIFEQDKQRWLAVYNKELLVHYPMYTPVSFTLSNNYNQIIDLLMELSQFGKKKIIEGWGHSHIPSANFIIYNYEW